MAHVISHFWSSTWLAFKEKLELVRACLELFVFYAKRDIKHQLKEISGFLIFIEDP